MYDGKVSLRLWLEDEIPPPDDTWTIAQSSEVAVGYIDMCRSMGCVFEVASLDHDLAVTEGHEDDVMRVLEYMIDQDYWPRELYVHTGNEVAEEWMVGLIRLKAPPGTLKGWGMNFWGTGPSTQIQNWED